MIDINLSINTLIKQRNSLIKEVQDLLKQRDEISSEISSQREAKNIVYKEQYSLEELRYFLDEQTKILIEMKDKHFNDFSNNYEKHNLILKQITTNIESAKGLLEQYKVSEKEIEQLEVKKDNLIQDISSKRIELTIVTDDINKKQKQLDKDISKNEGILLKIEQGKEDLLREKETIKQKEDNLKLYEKRLLKLKK